MMLKRIVDGRWQYLEMDRSGVKVGDELQFSVSGVGRGGHYQVTAMVVKCNRKTFETIECEGSYHPGKRWIVNPDHTHVYVVR